MVNSMYQRPNRDWHSVNQTKLMCKILEMDYEIMRTLNPYRLVINNSYFILHIDSWEYQIVPPNCWNSTESNLHRWYDIKGGIHKLRWQDFAHYWPPTLVKEFLYDCTDDISSTTLYLPTSSFQRSLWTPPK